MTGTGGIGIFEIDSQGAMSVRFSFVLGNALSGTPHRLAEIGIFTSRGGLVANLSNFAGLGNLVGHLKSDDVYSFCQIPKVKR